MEKHSNDNWDELRAKIMGLGESSLRKSYYPELQQKLAELERFKALLDQVNDIILVLRVPNGHIVDISQSASRNLGYSREELLQMTTCDLMPPETSPSVLRFLSEAEHGAGRQDVFTTSFTKKGGEALPVEITMRLVTFHGTMYAVAVARDITARERAREALEKTEEKYRVLVESSPDAIIMVEPVEDDRRIVSCNKAFLDLFGFDKEELEGKSVRILFPSEESFQSLWEKACPIIQEEGSFRAEWELMRKNGEVFTVEETISVINNPNSSMKGYVAIIRDITERKKTEEELRRYREQLEEMVKERTRALEEAQKALVQKEKLKTLGAISAEVAHEIRNPVMSIGGFAKRLQKKTPDIPEVRIIVDESERLEKILKRIRNYLKPAEMRPQEFSVNTIVTDCTELLSHEMKRKRVNWQLDLASDLPLAYVDPGILTEVLINIVKNAVRFMNSNSTLTIKTFESDQNIHIQFRSFGMRTKIADPETALLPFDEGGHGLGVPIAVQTLKDMGGFLTITQDENTTVFTVSLLKTLRPKPEREEKREAALP